MKLSKFAKLVKWGGYCHLFHVTGNGIWLGTRYGVYRAAGLPETVDSKTILPILDFDPTTAQKITVNEEWFDSTRDINGLNLSDSSYPDITAKRYPLSVVYKGKCAVGLLCDDEELVFYDDNLLSPVNDVLQKSQYAEIVVRVAESGRRFVVVRDGMETIAGIMPVAMLDKEFLADLADFEARCTEQHLKNEARNIREIVREEDEEQTSLEGMEEMEGQK